MADGPRKPRLRLLPGGDCYPTESRRDGCYPSESRKGGCYPKGRRDTSDNLLAELAGALSGAGKRRRGGSSRRGR